jgi:hypothetical protein
MGLCSWQLGALCLHHAFVHGHLDTTSAPSPADVATSALIGKRR